MFNVLYFLVAGILIGVLFHRQTWLPKVSEKLSTIIIYLLLFTLGIKAGSDRNVMSRLDTLGITALEISLFAVFGSVLTAWVVYTYVFKKIK
jgi:uncharacterized membrane protein YbjE (DUF340 family)